MAFPERQACTGRNGLRTGFCWSGTGFFRLELAEIGRGQNGLKINYSFQINDLHCRAPTWASAPNRPALAPAKTVRGDPAGASIKSEHHGDVEDNGQICPAAGIESGHFWPRPDLSATIPEGAARFVRTEVHGVAAAAKNFRLHFPSPGGEGGRRAGEGPVDGALHGQGAPHPALTRHLLPNGEGGEQAARFVRQSKRPYLATDVAAARNVRRINGRIGGKPRRDQRPAPTQTLPHAAREGGL